jgi:hypothetical protein
MLAIRKETNEDKKELAYKILKEAFTPTTNDNKLANGHKRWDSIFQASHRGRYTSEVKSSEDWLLSSMTADEYAQYIELCKEIFGDIALGRVPETPYCYFFVRQDIEPEYQLVQNSHVALKLGVAIAQAEPLTNNPLDYENIHFVCIGVPDLEALIAVGDWLISIGVKARYFNEPDLRDEITAIGTFPVKGKDRKQFNRFELLVFDND